MKQRRLKVVIAAFAILAIASLAPPVHAATSVSFNPNGGGAVGAKTVDNFDEAVGNLLAVGGVTAVRNFLAGTGPTTFTDIYQATMAVISNQGVTQFSPGTPGVNQITVVARFIEQVTSVDLATNTVSFQLAANQTGSEVRMYSNPTVTANNLTGTGFTDGALILRGVPILTADSTGTFTLGSSPKIQAYDQFDSPSAYPGINSVVGNGGAGLAFRIVIGGVDKSYFVAGVTAGSEFDFTADDATPFKRVSPSKLFWTGRTPDIGAVNGITGPDFQFQSDANSNFTTPRPIPEPSTVVLSLLGVGLLGVAGLRRR